MLIWLALAEAAVPCGTLRMLQDAPEARRGVVLRAGPEKGLRDIYGVPNLLESENFVVRWGSGERFTDDELDNLLESLELGWRGQMVEMGHPPPYGADAFRFNVYIGNTGDGAPEIAGAAGYFTPDEEGWPMIVMDPSVVRDKLTTEGTAVHELYHAVQSATGRYGYEGVSAWYWEATAEWAAMQVVPDNPLSGAFAFGYLMLPELPVNFFDYPDTGELQEYHQYGAFMFPYDLTEQHGWELVRDSWTDPGTNPDPLEVMRAWLGARDADLDELWLDHIAKNAVFDYPFGPIAAETIENAGPMWPEAQPISVELEWAGDEGRTSEREAPGRYGALAFRLRQSDPGTLRVKIDGDATGTRGNPAHFGARVIQIDDFGDPIYHPVPFEGLSGELSLEDIGTNDELYVVVGAWTPVAKARDWDTERFRFSWSILVEPAALDVPEAEDKKGCGCAQGAPGVGLLGLLGLLGLRRASGRNTRRSSLIRSLPLRVHPRGTLSPGARRDRARRARRTGGRSCAPSSRRCRGAATRSGRAPWCSGRSPH